jgi:protein-histidine pros-kinase
MEQTAPPDVAETRPSAEWLPHVVLGIASALLLTLLVAMLFYANSASQLLMEVQEYSWQADKLDALRIEVLNAETGARGFLVTGDEDYLDPFREGVTTMNAILSDIDKHPDKPRLNAKEFAHLKRLINAERTALSTAIDIRQKNLDPPEAVMDRGKDTMNEIRDSLNRLEARLSADNATHLVGSLSFLGKSRWAMIALFSGAFILLLGLFVLMQKQVRLRRRITALMNSETERLESLVKQRTVELNDLATYLTRINEAEKRHIAQELHDEMGALLTAARMDTTWMIRDLEPTLKEKYARRLSRLSESLDAAIRLKRKITTDLKPPLLQELGLIESLRAMVDDLAADDSYEVTMDLPERLPEMDDEKALAVFRITQESLTNIRKYARARHVTVSIREEHANMYLRIADDGLGFDANGPKSGGHGISGMQHRAQMFGGDLQVTSTPGQGTLVEARIPVHPSTGE